MKNCLRYVLSFVGLFLLLSCGSRTSSVTITFSPTDQASGVSLSATVTAVFSGAVAEPSGWESLFTLKKDNTGDSLCSMVTFNSSTLTVTCSHGDFDAGASYTLSLSGVTDSGGSALSGTATFTTRTSGDFNGDGYGDLAVGVVGANGFTGRVDMFWGSVSGLGTTAEMAPSGEVALDVFGWYVSLHGDFNGDGYSDLLVGAPYFSESSIGADKVYLYYGSASPSASPEADLTFTDGTGTDYYGGALSAGDLNGDGCSDAIIGAGTTDSGNGKVFIYYGAGPSCGSTEAMDTTLDLTLSGSNAGQFGRSVYSGDFNCDGYDDVIIGSPAEYKAYIYEGSSGGLASTASSTITDETASEMFSIAVSAADINGDGCADVVIGGPAVTDTGEVYVFYGSADGIHSSVTTEDADVTIVGGSGSAIGNTLATNDFNGDGYGDVFVSGNQVEGGTKRGYLYFGAAGTMDTDVDMTVSGGTEQSFVASGDFNGDGYADAVIGKLDSIPDVGAVDIYYGSASMDASPTADVNLLGSGSDTFGYSLSGNSP